jgi:hypothetical protein
MAGALISVSQARELFLTLLQVVDQRIVRFIARQAQPLREFSLQFGAGTDPLSALLLNTPITMVVPWDADAFLLRLWTQTGCTVTASFSVARAAAPTVFGPLSTVDYTADPYIEYEDSTVVTELGEGDSTPAPDPATRALSVTGFQIVFGAGDIVQVMLTASSGIPAIATDPATGDAAIAAVSNSSFGGELRLRLRPQQYTLTRTPA